MSKEKMIKAGRNGMPPMHPGEILKELYLEPSGLSVNKLALRMGVTATRMNQVVRGERGITADTALRLAKVFGTTAQLWQNLQNTYEVRLIETSEDESISRIQPFTAKELHMELEEEFA